MEVVNVCRQYQIALNNVLRALQKMKKASRMDICNTHFNIFVIEILTSLKRLVYLKDDILLVLGGIFFKNFMNSETEIYY